MLNQIHELQKVINDNNTGLLALIETLQKQVAELQIQIELLERTLIKIGREWGYSECGNFALSILVEQTIMPRGEDFVVDVIFVNISGEDLYIVTEGAFWPYLYNWPRIDFMISWIPVVRLVPNNTFFRNSFSSDGLWRLGFCLACYHNHDCYYDGCYYIVCHAFCIDVGVYDLKFMANFIYDYQHIDPYEIFNSNLPHIRLYSNSVEIIVTSKN